MILRASLAQPLAAPWAAAAGITAALAAIVGARWLATRLGADALLVGAAFGLALLVLWAAAAGAAGRFRRTGGAGISRTAVRRAARSVAARVALGVAVGLVLILVAVAGPSLGGVVAAPGSLRPAAPFAAWALVTLIVATAEEGILRGVLFDRLRQGAGTAVALALTTVAFALLHVPLYGWEIVPLDLAVGLALGGLRLATGGVVAPAVAHLVADLATWWL